MNKICFSFLLLAFFVNALKLDLKRYETRMEKLVRTGQNLTNFRKQKQREFIHSSVFSNKRPKGSRFFSVEDIGFTVQLGFGTPPQMLTMIPDLSVGDTWVVDSKCVGHPDCPDSCIKRCTGFFCPDCCYDKAPDHCSLAGNFSSTASNTYYRDGRPWDPYGNGLLKGFLGVDDILMPGSDGPKNLEYATFVQISQLGADTIDDKKISGVFGLGTQTEMPFEYKTLFNLAAFIQLFKNPFFTLWLDVDSEKKNKLDGQFILGDYATDVCSDVYTNADLKYFDQGWTFKINNLNISALGISTATLAQVHLYEDSIYIPGTDLFKLTDKLGATFNFQYDLYEVKCSTKLTIEIMLPNSQPSIVLNEDDLITKVNDGQTCLLNLDNSYDFDDAVGLALGKKFFRRHCVTFNQQDDKISFALWK
ncbi:hypothetical protein M3Y97_00649100 [Aphelenchoides bicaudatus]|nr:hypothetical protein M3Y97_00649100 [Aphelenchoides bicaudatus]